MGITYHINERPRAEEVSALAVSVGWNDPARHGLDLVQKVWDEAPVVILARDGERLVGMCRAMWDGGLMAEVRYVVVHPEYQRHGIGSELVQRLLAELDRLEVRHVTLVTRAGNESFYERFGFAVRPVTAMMKSRSEPEEPADG